MDCSEAGITSSTAGRITRSMVGRHPMSIDARYVFGIHRLRFLSVSMRCLLPEGVRQLSTEGLWSVLPIWRDI